MNIVKELLSASILVVVFGLQGQEQKTQQLVVKGPSIAEAMSIKNNIVVPLHALSKKNHYAMVKELAAISEDLFKLAHNKIAGKYTTYTLAQKSFEPGLLESESKFAYLESWRDLVNKRLKKLSSYENRLAKIQERVLAFDKKLKSVKGINDPLRSELESYSSKIKAKIEMTSGWIASSYVLFNTERTMLKNREKAFKKAGVY